MKRIFLLFVVVIPFSGMTQDSTVNKKALWKMSGMFQLIAAQAGARNWAPTGSEKFALSGAASLQLQAVRKWKRNAWDNTADLTYGLIKFYSQHIRKIDDKFDLYSKYGYSLTPITSIGIVGALRTQFSNGYDFTELPRKRVSGFFAPAYVTISPGIQLKTRDASLSVHLGPAVRWVIISNEPYSLVYQGGVKPDGSTERTLAELYGVSPGKKVRVEAGSYLSALYKKEVMKNVLWKTRVDVHSDIKRDEPFNVDVYWTNTVSMKVNKWLRVKYNFDLYRDEDVKMSGRNKNESAVQMLSMLGVGLALTF